jgi:hypothetical protein
MSLMMEIVLKMDLEKHVSMFILLDDQRSEASEVGFTQ